MGDSDISRFPGFHTFDLKRVLIGCIFNTHAAVDVSICKTVTNPFTTHLQYIHNSFATPFTINSPPQLQSICIPFPFRLPTHLQPIHNQFTIHLPIHLQSICQFIYQSIYNTFTIHVPIHLHSVHNPFTSPFAIH